MIPTPPTEPTAEPVAVGECLRAPGSPARKLWAQLDRLAQIQTAIRDWAGDPLARSLSVANFRDGLLFLNTDSAAALTQVRYRQQELLQFLQNRLGVDAVRLEVKVNPSARSGRPGTI
ncbi:MAG: DUF721 domain-containing protein [Nevskia sp.]|nr:DUF721 domain-containing protein [Nevskia sp.]